MNRKILILALLTFFIFFSIGAIAASDADIAEQLSLNSSADIPICSEDAVQYGELEFAEGDDVSANDEGFDDKNRTELVLPSSGIYLNGRFNVTLMDLNSNATLPDKNVTFIINDVVHNATTGKDGVAILNLKLKVGNYRVTAYFAGDDAYGPSSNITSAIKIVPTIKAKNISKYYGGSTQYSATFLDTRGNALANATVRITVNGKPYDKKTDKNGVASLPVNLKPGTYRIVSTNPFTGYSLTTTFKILPTVTSRNLNKVLGDKQKFTVKFFTSDGKPLANSHVKLKINSKYYKFKTNSKGQVIVPFNNFKQGTYKVISYNNDGLSKTNTVRLFNIAGSKLTSHFYTILPSDKKEIAVELSTSLGGNANSGKIIKIKIGGKTYCRKTDGEGVAHLNLASFKKGCYIVEYSFEGNKFFKAAKSRNYVTLLDSTKTTFTVKSTKKFGYGAGTKLKVAFTAGGVPLVKRTMTLDIAGKKYTRTTDNDGIVSVPVNLKIGKYTVDCKTNRQFKIDGNSKSFKISVFKRSLPKIIWKGGSVYKDNLQVFKILLTGSKGKAVPGGKVILNIDSRNYTAKTLSNGYARFKSAVAIGKYRISIKFAGNNEYLPTHASKYVHVKLSKFGSGLNERNGVSYLSAYLHSSSHCPVNGAKIKALVKSLTRGLTNPVDRAKALFNFVRDNISYSYYYDSKLGAVGTLDAKRGNCVDQAHLLVAMYRTAGFKARYVHGTCVFADGVFGHVWTQVLIGNTWVCGDSINLKNSLGKVSNWNTNNYRLNGKYSSLPF